MADSIKFKRGAKAKLPSLNYGEPAFVSDEKELYIGTKTGNVKLTSKSEIEELKQKNTELSSQLEQKANEKQTMSNFWFIDNQPPVNGTSGSWFNHNTMGYNELISKYEELRDNAYIVRDRIGADASGIYDMYAYRFIPLQYSQTVMIISGVHGYEPEAPLALFRFFELLTNNYKNDKDLEYLRRNVRFIVVPCVNPWGFSQLPKKMENFNGVNLNRDTVNLSQYETQNINALIKKYANEITYFFDFHTTYNNTYGDYMLWYPTGIPNLNIYQKTINHLCERNIQDRKFDLHEFKAVDDLETFHNLAWKNYGIPSATVEHSDYVFSTGVGTVLAQTRAVENIGNEIIQNCRYFENIYKSLNVNEVYLMNRYTDSGTWFTGGDGQYKNIAEFNKVFEIKQDGVLEVDGYIQLKNTNNNALHLVYPKLINSSNAEYNFEGQFDSFGQFAQGQLRVRGFLKVKRGETINFQLWGYTTNVSETTSIRRLRLTFKLIPNSTIEFLT